MTQTSLQPKPKAKEQKKAEEVDFAEQMDLEEADQSRPMEMADSFGKKLRGMETQ